MTVKEAISCIADGHTLWRVGTAEEICKAFGLKLPKKLIVHYEGQKDANPTSHWKGLWLNEDKSIDGVNALNLSYWVTKALGIDTTNGLSGRGFQAQSNAEKVRGKLGLGKE